MVFNIIAIFITFEKCVVLGNHDVFLVKIGVISVDLIILERCTLNYWSEEFEYFNFDLLHAHLFVEDHDARLSQRLLGAEYHVARPLLSYHNLNRGKLTGVFIVLLALNGNNLVTTF